MQIVGLLGMYFDAAVVFVINFSFLFRLALAILWRASSTHSKKVPMHVTKLTKTVLCNQGRKRNHIQNLYKTSKIDVNSLEGLLGNFELSEVN